MTILTRNFSPNVAIRVISGLYSLLKILTPLPVFFIIVWGIVGLLICTYFVFIHKLFLKIMFARFLLLGPEQSAF